MDIIAPDILRYQRGMVEERERDSVDRQRITGRRDETVKSDDEADDGDQDEEQEEERDHVVLVAHVRPDNRKEREQHQEWCRRGGGDVQPGGARAGVSPVPGKREVEQNLHDGDDREKEDCKRERSCIPEQRVGDVGGEAGEHENHKAQADRVEHRLDRAEIVEPERLQHEDSGQEGEIEKGQGLSCNRYLIPEEAEADYPDEG